MNELQELYREVILDHNRQPRNFGKLDNADRVVEGVNPLCGDRMTLYVNLDGDQVRDIRFTGTGCAISVASSSLMTEKAKGHSIDELRTLFDRVHEMLTGNGTGADVDIDELDKLAALSGVRAYPTRVKCATLAWHALIGAISGSRDRISTE
ncbi:MAG: SUF system NifU family Fe-S cluster assembly protein [Rhodospirillaceae bacterium]|nr:SUF system NifU family Fe-S cluster assembly protein [Rhodospirillaceae bacterium]MDE0000195.1 SUF system NifU family Fe-S cluster assembly protein [Rhodospirillaceae bacterium]MDE0362040.1 SUF system NifU family Fe-S cluster assembly protein [Rhodospirillaceae bacterium]